MKHLRGDPCTTEGCGRTITRYTVAGLCDACYERHRRDDQRRTLNEPAAPLIPMTELAKQRAAGEPESIHFDGKVHPGIFLRLLLLGDSEEKAADLIGVSIDTLKHWIAVRPEMREALMHRKQRGGYLIEAATNLALGKMNSKGQFMGGDGRMLRFFLEHELGMNKENRAKAQDSRQNIRDMVNDESVKRLIQKMKALGNARTLEHDDGGGDVGTEDDRGPGNPPASVYPWGVKP